MKKSKINKFLISIIISVILMFLKLGYVSADVGSFESYDSGSSSSSWSSSSSDWGSSSSSSSWEWDDDYDFGDALRTILFWWRRHVWVLHCISYIGNYSNI